MSERDDPKGPRKEPKTTLDQYFGRSREELRHLADEMTQRYQTLVHSGMDLVEIAHMLGAETFLRRYGRRYVGYELDMKGFIKEELKKSHPLRLPLAAKHFNETIIPPDSTEVQLGKGDGAYEQPNIVPRTRLLIEVLTEMSLDYTVSDGENQPSMIRGLSYKAFTIPDINKIIFINNEEGNRTFCGS